MSEREDEKKHDDTYTPDNCKNVCTVRLWQPPTRVHPVHEHLVFRTETAQFLDEEMTEVVIVACEVLHVHGLGVLPGYDIVEGGVVGRGG